MNKTVHIASINFRLITMCCRTNHIHSAAKKAFSVILLNMYAADFPSRTDQAAATVEKGRRIGRTRRSAPSWVLWLVGGLTASALQISPLLAQNLGRWSGGIPFPNVPVSAAVLPNGQLLTWSSYQPSFFEGDIGTAASQTYTSVYNPATGAFTPLVENSMMADMFCSGIAYLADGRIMVNGGSSSYHTALYTPSTQTWVSGAMMNITRGYNSTVALSTGEAFTIGGSWAGDGTPKDGEVWKAGQGWRRTSISENNILGIDPIDIAQGFISEGDDHPWLFAAPNGRVFHAGPSPLMNWIDTRGDGSITPAGNRADDPYSINGIAVMYQPGKILKTGGAPSYTNAIATASTYAIDITAGLANPAAPVTVRKLPPMAYPRAYANGVLLPGGKVLVIGGQSNALQFTDDTAVPTPELWDPATERFTALAPMQTPRNYHSTALLLPDGRVFSGGGGLCGTDCDANHQDGAIFSPPYLFNADGVTPAPRPVIQVTESVPPATALSGPFNATLSVLLGSTFAISASEPIKSFELIRLSSTTHSINTDQRRVPLTIAGVIGTNYAATMPANPGIVVPGYWMLFALDAIGTPSVAKIILIKS